MTTQADIQNHRAHGSWRRLADIALDMSRDAAKQAQSAFNPRLGGGTRLMLALNHRISHDVDLFIRDPQWLAYLTPRLNDRFEHLVDAYDEGSSSLKLRLADGEIDFIVSMDLLDLPSDSVPDCAFALEAVAEVLAKKLFYRGWALTPRDLFDWWSIAQMQPYRIPHPQLAKLLRAKLNDIGAALKLMQASAHTHTIWNSILAPHKPELSTAVAWAQLELTAYQALI